MTHAEPDVNEQAEAASEDPADGAAEEWPPKARPLWTYFLTPLAVVIGAVIIGAAILYADDDAKLAPASVLPSADAVSQSNIVSAPPANLLAAFLGYAKTVGIDEGEFQQCLANTERGLVINRHLQRGSALNIDGTPTFVINNKKVIGAQPTAIFQEIISAELRGSPTSLDAYSDNVKALAATVPPRFEILPQRVDTSEANFEGNPNARVVIAEFSDFQCPFCKRWTEDTLRTLRPQFGNDVALAFLHYPIVQIHPNAGNASLAALCAGDQGKFWPMHDLLFARQTEWQSLRAN